MLPKRFLWRLTLLNVLVIAPTIGISSWAIYNTACFLVEGMGNFDVAGQFQFNQMLYRYLWLFSSVIFLVSSIFQFYFTKKLIRPVHQLIEATKTMKQGTYPARIAVTSEDEVGELVQQYNELIQQLQMNEAKRKKQVADLSHEVRTPLSNLNGYLQALKNEMIPGNPALFASLYKESNRLTMMVRQLDKLNEWDYLAAQKVFPKEAVQISEQIDQGIAMFNWRLMQERILIERNVSPAELVIHIAGFQQALSNLLDNAIDYYEGTGPIGISGELSESYYRVTVTGPGRQILDAEKEKLFDRFYRCDESVKQGTGLGLAIVKGIVENAGGEVRVKSFGGLNSFSFTLRR